MFNSMLNSMSNSMFNSMFNSMLNHVFNKIFLDHGAAALFQLTAKCTRLVLTLLKPSVVFQSSLPTV